MQYVNNDFLALVFEVNERRLPMMLEKISRLEGGPTSIGEQRLREIVTARSLNRRFLFGDYRADAMELGRLRSLCEWLVEQYALSHGRTPDAVPFEWNEPAMWSIDPLPDGQYGRIRKIIISGELG